MGIDEIKQKLLDEKKHRRENLINSLQTMSKFTEEYIPSVPITDRETYENIVIPNFIRCGAIPKSKLIVGKKYFGSCRNASEAVWLGNEFEYIRTKFGYSYKEKINHFEDDDGYDLFVPIKEL